MKNIEKDPFDGHSSALICRDANQMKDLLEGPITNVIQKLEALKSEYGDSYMTLTISDYSVDPYHDLDYVENQLWLYKPNEK